MSLAKFKQLIDENANIITIDQYIKCNKDALIKLLDDSDRHQNTSFHDDTDPYVSILSCFFKTSLTDFIKTQLPWKMIQKYYFQFDINDLLTKQDLEVERMIDVNNSQLYFNILKIFLIDHKVNEIPESFLKHYENINMCYILNLPMHTNSRYFFDHLANPHQTVFLDKYIVKQIELLILFLERFDIEPRSAYVETFHTKEELFETLKGNFYNSQLYDETREEIYEVNGVTVTENNVVDFCFAKLRNDLLDVNDRMNNFIIILADYFEYMQLDQQMEFWNILIEEDKCTIEVTFNQTTSDTFLNFSFDNYEPLKTEAGVYDIIFRGYELEDNTLNFYRIILQRYPSIRPNLIMYLIIVDNYVCNGLFPDLSNQEIVSVFRAKFL